MKKTKPAQGASLTELTNYMLCSIMPTADDPRDCLMELGVKPTCAASIVFGMIQKAAKGDTSAAKFIKEMNGEGLAEEEISEKMDLRNASEAILYRMAKTKLEEMQNEEK